MKKTMLKLPIILVGVLIIGALVYIGFNFNALTGANAQMSNVNHISTAIAENSIKEFTTSQVKSIDNVTTSHDDYYEIVTSDGAYYVNAKSGVVESLSYNKNSSYDENDVSGKNITVSETMSQAQNIAKDFVSAHYSQFSTMKNMNLTQAELIDRGSLGKVYMFSWIQQINGINMPNKTIVTVDATTGQVLSYLGIQRPVVVQLTPTITKNQAINIATRLFNDTTVIQTNASLSVTYRNDSSQALAWDILVKGQPVNGMPRDGEVLVDAQDGTIIGNSQTL